MSAQNDELVRKGTEAINRAYRSGEMSEFERFVERHCDPEITLETGTSAFTEGEWKGHDGVVGFVANQMEVMEDMWLRVDESYDAGPDAILLAVTFGGRASHTGLDIEMSPYHLFEMRDGKTLRWVIFTERAEAFSAAGIES